MTTLGPFNYVEASGGDDSAAINSAASGLAGGGKIILPNQFYKGSALILPAGVTLEGMGPGGAGIGNGGTVITGQNATEPVFVFGGSFAQVKNLTITGAASQAITDAGNAGLQECVVEDVDIQGGGANIGDGFALSGNGGYYCRVHKSRIDSVNGKAINLTGTNALELELAFLNLGGNNHSTHAVYAKGIPYFSMTRVDALEFTTAGFATTDCNLDADYCLADTCGVNNWFLQNTNPGAVPGGDGARIIGGWASSSQSGYGAYFINLPLQLIGFDALDNYSYGIVAVATPGQATKTPMLVSACNIHDNGRVVAAHGAYFNNVELNASGNRAAGATQQYGIFCDSGTVGALNGTTGSGNTSGLWHIAGTMTQSGNMPP